MTSIEESARMEELTATFVSQYYSSLVSQPQSVCQWYGEESFSAHGNAPSCESKPLNMVSGPFISEKLYKLADEFSGSKVSILQVDWQPSVPKTTMVSVWGVAVTATDAKYFHHIFILSQTKSGGFFIRNDIFQFLPSVPQQVVQQEEPAVQEEQQSESVEAQPVEESRPTESPAKPKKAKKAQQQKVVEEPAAPVAEEPATLDEDDGEHKPDPLLDAPVQQNNGPVAWSSVVQKPGTKAAVREVQRVQPRSTPPPAEKEDSREATPRKEKREPKPARREALCRLTFVLNDEVSDAVLKEALGDAAQHLVEVRKKWNKNDMLMVFTDFDKDVYDYLRELKPEIGGRTVLVTHQKEREKK